MAQLRAWEHNASHPNCPTFDVYTYGRYRGLITKTKGEWSATKWGRTEEFKTKREAVSFVADWRDVR